MRKSRIWNGYAESSHVVARNETRRNLVFQTRIPAKLEDCLGKWESTFLVPPGGRTVYFRQRKWRSVTRWHFKQARLDRRTARRQRVERAKPLPCGL